MQNLNEFGILFSNRIMPSLKEDQINQKDSELVNEVPNYDKKELRQNTSLKQQKVIK